MIFFFAQVTFDTMKTASFFLLGVWSFFAQGLNPAGPLSLSLSGAGRAKAQEGAEYHLLNPASLAHALRFHGAAFYVFKTAQTKPYWGISLIENRQVPLALSYIKESDSKEQYFNISTAGFILPGWSVGLSLIRWESAQDTNWNIQMGFLIKPQGAGFSIGAVGEHILPLRGVFKQKRRWAGGINYHLYKWLSLTADTVYNPDTRWEVMGGATFTIAGFLIVRVGAGWNFTEKSPVFSGGAGLTTRQISLDYGLSQTRHEQEFLHTLNIRTAF